MLDTATEILARVGDSKFFTSFDATQDFHQISLAQELSRLTYFVTPFGKYRFLRMPMGICNAPEIFPQVMVETDSGILNVEVYIDEIFIYAPTIVEHDATVRAVFKKFRQAGITLNREKSVVGVRSISFLGHELSCEGFSPKS